MKAAIRAIEYYLPDLTEDNEYLQKDKPDWVMEEIVAKTGILKRHICRPDETAVDLAIAAAENLFVSGVKRDEADFLIFITQSPDYMLPTSACILQDRLNLRKSCTAFDVNLGCSGFVYALAIAGSFIEAAIAKSGLIICSETYSKYIRNDDRTCRPVFSDGASASFISMADNECLGPFVMGTDGSGHGNLIVRGSGSRKERKSESGNSLFMDGPKVFMFTMQMVPACVNALLGKAGKTISDIDMFIFHQASRLVIDNIVKALRIPAQKLFVNYSQVGNTVSSTIPIALKDAANAGKIVRGDSILLAGFGVGYSWGSCLINWQGIL